MNFQEIFNEKGLYKANGFVKGYCYEVDSDGWLYSLSYNNINDISPIRERAFVSKYLFDKDFVKVFNRNQLFD